MDPNGNPAAVARLVPYSQARRADPQPRVGPWARRSRPAAARAKSASSQASGADRGGWFRVGVPGRHKGPEGPARRLCGFPARGTVCRGREREEF
jgi:hypothetical protein